MVRTIVWQSHENKDKPYGELTYREYWGFYFDSKLYVTLQRTAVQIIAAGGEVTETEVESLIADLLAGLREEVIGGHGTETRGTDVVWGLGEPYEIENAKALVVSAYGTMHLGTIASGTMWLGFACLDKNYQLIYCVETKEGKGNMFGMVQADKSIATVLPAHYDVLIKSYVDLTNKKIRTAGIIAGSSTVQGFAKIIEVPKYIAPLVAVKSGISGTLAAGVIRTFVLNIIEEGELAEESQNVVLGGIGFISDLLNLILQYAPVIVLALIVIILFKLVK